MIFTCAFILPIINKCTPFTVYDLKMNEKDVNELLNAIAINGDRSSFKKLYQFYYRKLFCLAKSFVKTAEDAEEIVNDTFLSLWAKRVDLPLIQNFTVYVCTAIRNKSLNHISKLKINRHLSLEEIDAEICGNYANGEDKLLADDLQLVLERTLIKLPPQCRLVFKLVKEDGFKYKEVAELLDVSVKAIEYHMGYAFKRIWESLPADFARYKQKNKNF